MPHPDRLQHLRAALGGRPLLVTNLVNVRYLTGFAGSNAFLAVWPGKAVFVTDGRYAEVAASLVRDLPECELEVYQTGHIELLASLFSGDPEFAVEADALTWDMARRLGEAASGEIIPVTGALAELRMRKDPTEVAALERAAAAGDAAYSRLGDLRSAADSEGELGWMLIEEMRRAGGEMAAWEPIVAAGAHASLPHYRAGGSPLGDGLLLLDYGCVVDGYHSDMSRTSWLDGEPPQEIERMYTAVLAAQEEAIASVRPGVAAGDVDAAARGVLAGYGYEEQFVHSTGHGVGLEIHEPPWLRRGSEVVLEAGHVVTIEPGVYVSGLGGVRIEDMVLVGEEPRVLTQSPKNLVAA